MNGHIRFADLKTRPHHDWPNEGLYKDLPAEKYHKAEGRASSSILRTIHTDTCAHAKAQMEGSVEPRPAMGFGTQIHMAVLQPSRYESRYAVAEQCYAAVGSGDRCDSSGERPYQAADGSILWFCGRPAHQPDLDEDDPTAETFTGEVPLSDSSRSDSSQADVEELSRGRADKIGDMQQALRDHRVAPKLLFEKEGISEVSMTWTHEQTGVPCKARVDRVVRYPELGHLAIDYKTTRDADPSADGFGRAIERRRYDMQGALCFQGLAAVGIHVDAFCIVAQETRPPYAISVILLPGDRRSTGNPEVPDLRSAEGDLLHALQEYKQCARTNHWPGYRDIIVQAEVPASSDAGIPRDDRD